MALYDDLDKTPAEKVAAWSSGIKLFQQNLAIKSRQVPQANKKASAVIYPILKNFSPKHDIF